MIRASADNKTGYGFGYDWDGARFNNRAAAIRHGLKTRGSDDFNIGQTYGDDLIWFGWMDERLHEDDDTMRDIAEAIGLDFNPKWNALKFTRATGEAALDYARGQARAALSQVKEGENG